MPKGEFGRVLNDSGKKKLADAVGEANVSCDAAHFNSLGWEGALPTASVTPESAEQLCAVVRLAASERWRIAPAGNLTKPGMGGVPREIDLVVALNRLNRVTDYQPADLTVTAEAGASVEALANVLGEQGQMLPLDVPFAAAGATVGGVMATFSSGPRRLGYGSVRDLAIGVRFVTLDGKLAKGGGKVVKNVAGYDMMKMLIGSFGTLAIIADATFKVLPVPKSSTTLIAGFAGVRQAFAARDRILNSPLAPQALDFMDKESGSLIGADVLREAPFSLAVHAAGPEPAVERVRRELPEMVRHEGGTTIAFLDGDRERQFWNAVQETTPAALRLRREIAVLKISAILSQLPTVVEEAHRTAAQHGLGSAIVARAGTGIVYCYLWPQSGGDLSTERMAMACEILLSDAERLGGYAAIEWCPFELKSTLRQWGPVGDDFALMQRLKREFDPERLLNPGRLFGKI